MSKNKLLVAGGIFVALTLFKILFPSASGAVIDKAGELLSRDIDYRAALNSLSDSIAVFGGSREEKVDSSYIPVAIPAPAPGNAVRTMALTVDSAVNEGEVAAFTGPRQPEVVAAFLESQSEYAHLELPDTVTYDYLSFPDSYSVPVSGYNSSGFGYRMHPIHEEVRFHYGTDFAAWSGENIYAFADGTVSFAGYSESFGNYITIDHSDGWQSLYAHCSILYVNTGDSVSAGQLIALVGDTGLVTGPHLHFELSRDGVYVNPEYYVN